MLNLQPGSTCSAVKGGFNTEQEEYNKRYRDYFLRMPDPPAPIDGSS